jgi:hypothetical protein
MTDPKPYSWQTLHVSAILEIDPSKMLDRTEQTLKAIDEKLRNPSEMDGHEFKAIKNGQIGLAALRTPKTLPAAGDSG